MAFTSQTTYMLHSIIIWLMPTFVVLALVVVNFRELEYVSETSCQYPQRRMGPLSIIRR